MVARQGATADELSFELPRKQVQQRAGLALGLGLGLGLGVGVECSLGKG